MKPLRYLVLLAISLTFLSLSSAPPPPMRRIDVILEYTGIVDWKKSIITLSSVSEEIQTLIDVTGQINYDVITRLKGSVTFLNGTMAWNEMGVSYNATLDVSFGGSHIFQPHVIHATTLGPARVLPSHHEIMTSIAQCNITGGEGAFAGAVGGLTINGYHSVSGIATWVVNIIFWVPVPLLEVK